MVGATPFLRRGCCFCLGCCTSRFLLSWTKEQISISKDMLAEFERREEMKEWINE